MLCPLFSLPNPEEGLTSDRSVAGTGLQHCSPSEAAAFEGEVGGARTGGPRAPTDLWGSGFGRGDRRAPLPLLPLPSKRGGRAPTHTLAAGKRNSEGLRYLEPAL